MILACCLLLAPIVLGVEVSDRPSAFVDLAKVARPFQTLGSDKPASLDVYGWPTEDCQAVFMDDRTVPAWAPPIDDPEKFQIDDSGTYHLSLSGRAVISPAGGSPVQVSGVSYDSAANTTSANVTLPKGALNLIVLQFSHTQGGFKNLRLIRPGYPVSTRQLFTSEFLRSLKPFAYLRFMGWLDTNYQPGYYGDAGHHQIRWQDRSLPTDAIQGEGLRSSNHGYCWEYLIDLANTVHKDMWINIPVAATEDYVVGLARRLKEKLDKDLNIYVEDSNEVWNFGFPQYTWNKLASEDEVAHATSPLNNDGSTDHEQWARRRHALRLYKIAKAFERAFGAGSLNTRIRPVYAAWTIQPDSYDEVLGWMQKTFGPVKSYFYAIASTGYFNDQHAAKDASVDQVLAAMNADADTGKAYTLKLKSTADKYDLKLAWYEAGPDNGGGSTVNIGNRIEANRSPKMEALVLHNFRDNFFSVGGDLATYFALSSAYSRWGCWGATDDLANLHTSKFKAIAELVKR